MSRKRKIKGKFCEDKIASKSMFDPRSFRYKKSGKSWIIVGCPKGRWDAEAKRCRVGTTAHKMLLPSRGNGCPVGAKHVWK